MFAKLYVKIELSLSERVNILRLKFNLCVKVIDIKLRYKPLRNNKTPKYYESSLVIKTSMLAILK